MKRLVTLLVLVGVLCLPTHAKKAHEAVQDTSSNSTSFIEIISWPFIHIIQPVFGMLVYPVAAPLHYAVDNGVADKAVDLITFGENRNILIYPMFNLKPGSSSMIGLCYRHRNLFQQGGYGVFEGHYYANSDFDIKLRYSKQGLFGKKLYGSTSFNMYMDRDNGYTLPGTKVSFDQADTTYSFSAQLSFPITESRNLNFSFGTEFVYHKADFTDTKDSVLDDPVYPIEDRGLYQSHFEIPFYANLVFDNLDVPYAPSRGQRFSISASYVFTGKYGGISADDFALAGVNRSEALKDGGKNHDFVNLSAFYQIYFFMGSFC